MNIEKMTDPEVLKSWLENFYQIGELKIKLEQINKRIKTVQIALELAQEKSLFSYEQVENDDTNNS